MLGSNSDCKKEWLQILRTGVTDFTCVITGLRGTVFWTESKRVTQLMVYRVAADEGRSGEYSSPHIL